METELAKTRIVVVDDEPDILELYENVLGESFEIQSFNDPELFIKELKAKSIKPFDLLISDLKMPSMTGLQMIKEAKKEGWNFPFILLSGYLDKETAIEAVDVGVYKLLEKPTEFSVLIATIDKLLMEHEVENVRREIRSITSQLRELYASIRFILLDHIPKEVIDRLVVEADSQGNVKEKMSFEALLERLEVRLEQLLESEKVMTEGDKKN